MISKEEIKAKKQATIKRNKEEAEQKKAAGFDTCRGCSQEFQKIDTKAAATCSWECALSASQTGNYSYLTGRETWQRDNGKCWTNYFLETITHKHEERELKDVADELYCEKKQIDMDDNCETFGCERMNRKCVNWHHFKTLSNLEWLLHDSELEDIPFYLEKIIKNSKENVLQRLLLENIEDIAPLSDRIEEENERIRECQEILKRIKTER